MELWKELLITGLQNENNMYVYLNDKILKEIVENSCIKFYYKLNKQLKMKVYQIKTVLLKLKKY